MWIVFKEQLSRERKNISEKGAWFSWFTESDLNRLGYEHLWIGSQVLFTCLLFFFFFNFSCRTEGCADNLIIHVITLHVWDPAPESVLLVRPNFFASSWRGWGAWRTQGSTVKTKGAGEMKKEDIYLAEIVAGNKWSISTYGWEREKANNKTVIQLHALYK